MKRISIIPLSVLLALVVVVSGCGQTQNVVSDSWIQKRKHRSGFHMNSPFGHHRQSSDKKEAVSLVHSELPVANAQIEKRPRLTPTLIEKDEKSMTIQRTVNREFATPTEGPSSSVDLMEAKIVIQRDRVADVPQDDAETALRNRAIGMSVASLLSSLVLLFGVLSFPWLFGLVWLLTLPIVSVWCTIEAFESLAQLEDKGSLRAVVGIMNVISLSIVAFAWMHWIGTFMSGLCFFCGLA